MKGSGWEKRGGQVEVVGVGARVCLKGVAFTSHSRFGG